VGGHLGAVLEVLADGRQKRREDGEHDAGQHEDELDPDDPGREEDASSPTETNELQRMPSQMIDETEKATEAN
jgi:hypothetical protein